MSGNAEEEFGGHPDPGSLPQREGVPVDPEETCDTCLHGRGDYINDGERDDFYCHNEKVPFDKRIIKTPETPACPLYVAVIKGYRARIAMHQREREARERPVYRGEDGTDLTDQQHRDELDAARQHEKGMRQPSSYKIMKL